MQSKLNLRRFVARGTALAAIALVSPAALAGFVALETSGMWEGRWIDPQVGQHGIGKKEAARRLQAAS